MGRFSTITFQRFLLLCIVPFLNNAAFGQKTAIMVKVKKAKHPEPIKLNTDSFQDLVLGSDVLIDRSMLIKEILESTEQRLIIACPPKWSKSVNLNMIKTFVQIETDINGQQLQTTNRSRVYQMFQYGKAFNDTQNESFEKPFLISQHRDVIDRYLGKYPVVHIRFNLIDGISEAGIVENLKTIIRGAYEPHRYLLNLLRQAYKNIDKKQTSRREKAKEYFSRVKRILEGTEGDKENIINSLEFLCKLLHRHFDKRVFVLIDDYDLPYKHLLNSEYFREYEIPHILNHIKDAIDPILVPNHPWVERVIITATYRITDIMEHHAESIPDYTLANNPWLEYFAINDHEQRQLCKQVGNTDEQCQKAFEWYMGYKSTSDEGLNLGQPFSTANFLLRNSTEAYTYGHLQSDYMFELFRIKPLREIFESMIDSKYATIRLHNRLRFRRGQIRHLKHLFVTALELNIHRRTIDMVFSYLCATGYLTFTKPNPTDETVRIWIPNKETLVDICSKLKAYYTKEHGILHTYVTKTVQRLRDYVRYNDAKQVFCMRSCLNYIFSNIKRYDPDITNLTITQYHEEVTHAVLSFISLIWRSMIGCESTIWNEVDPPTSYMMGVKDTHGVIVAIQYNRPSEDLLLLAKKQKHRLEQYKNPKFYKFVAFSVDAKNKVIVKTG